MRLVCRPTTPMPRTNPFAAVRFATTGLMVMAMAMHTPPEVRTG
ncbi:MAG TPA: hypothetical protein VN923_18895 [Thermoanaerobaculia bacterium]|nr:hypothetical protein [Thermoanaerobaculia bacterium]